METRYLSIAKCYLKEGWVRQPNTPTKFTIDSPDTTWMTGTGLTTIWRKKQYPPLALGRKNYLFCGNDDAAESGSYMYMFWNIHAYDKDYSKDLAELLPHNRKSENSQKR